jgi:hypothetical protein
MKVLGSLFLLVLILAGIGYARGWFSVAKSHAGGKTGVALTVDDDKITDDAAVVANKLGVGDAKEDQSPQPATGSGGANASDIEGVITLVDLAGRDLTVTVGGETIVQHVPTSVAATRGGVAVPFEQLRANMRARFSFEQNGGARHLVRLELLP